MKIKPKTFFKPPLPFPMPSHRSRLTKHKKKVKENSKLN